MNREIARQRLAHPEESDDTLHYLAFRRLSDETGTIQLIDRLETRLFTHFEFALDRLRFLGSWEFCTRPRTIPEKSENVETNPAPIPGKIKIPETNPTNPAPKLADTPNSRPHHHPKCTPRPNPRSPQTTPAKIDIIETESSRTDPAQAEMTTRLLILIAATTSAGLAQPTPDYRAILNQYCVTCHNEKTKTAGLTLEKIDLTRIPADADIWEKVIRKVRVGMMPPQSAPHPDAATREALVAYLQTTLDRAAGVAQGAHPDPGRPLVHRLNRAEYANAIRDLLALEVDPSSLLPPDDPATASTTSPTCSASRRCCSSAIWRPPEKSARWPSAIPTSARPARPTASGRTRRRTSHIEGLPLGTVGGMLAKPRCRSTARYVLAIHAVPDQPRGHARPRVPAPARDHRGWRARPPGPFGGDADFKANLEEHDEGGRRRRDAAACPPAAQGRPARDHRGLPRADADALNPLACSRSSAARPTRSIPSGTRISTRSP